MHFGGPGQPGIQGAWGAHAHGEQGGGGGDQGIDVVVHKKVPDAACEGPPRPGVPPAPRAIAAHTNLASLHGFLRPASDPIPSFSSFPSPPLSPLPSPSSRPPRPLQLTPNQLLALPLSTPFLHLRSRAVATNHTHCFSGRSISPSRAEQMMPGC